MAFAFSMFNKLSDGSRLGVFFEENSKDFQSEMMS